MHMHAHTCAHVSTLLMSKKLLFKTHQSPLAPTTHTRRSPGAKGEEEQGLLPPSLPGDPAAWLPCRGQQEVWGQNRMLSGGLTETLVLG